MDIDRIRQSFKPLFGSDRSKAVERLLYIILGGVIVVDLIDILLRLWIGKTWQDPALQALFVLLFMQFGLLFTLKRGYIHQTAVMLAVFSWIVVTYLAWNAYGVHDVAIFGYVLIILTAALLANWRVALSLTVLSVLAIWFFAIAEASGLRTGSFDPPVAIARDLTIMFSVLILLIYLVVNTLRQALEKMQQEITERTRTEFALRREEENFRKIFRVTPVAVAITTLQDGRLVDANDTYWKLTGLKRETSLERRVMELNLWESEAERRDFVKRLMEQKSVHIPAHELVDVDGQHHSTSAFYELIDLGDEPTILSMHYDMTEQRKAETALQRSDERFHKVFQTSPVAIVITSLEDGRIMDANMAFWKLSGHDPKTSTARTALELRQDLTPEIREHFVRKLIEQKSIQDLAYDFINDRGEHFNTVAFYELIEVDSQPAILSMFYDMTEQSKARDAVRQSEARFRVLLEAIPDMVFEMKSDGTIFHFIPAAINEIDFAAEDIVGKNIAQILPVIAEQTAFAIQRALDSGQLHAFEFCVEVNGENKTFEARITPAGPDIVLAMIRDVSLSKWSGAERENLIGELEQKNAELERFTYTVSHDLKSPLITIRGFLGFVWEDAKAGNMDRLEKDIQRINDATEKMQRLLGDLLELSRVGRINQKPVHISTNELISEVVELLHGRLMLGNVEVSVVGNLPSIYGDRPRIFEVFQNLIDNAAKFMGEQPKPQIHIGVNGELDGNPVFYVRDNGIGIAPQFRERVFGLFNKLNPLSEGTGIGLALVRRIVEFHGGRIWVESEVGQGTTFLFTFLSKPVQGS